MKQKIDELSGEVLHLKSQLTQMKFNPNIPVTLENIFSNEDLFKNFQNNKAGILKEFQTNNEFKSKTIDYLEDAMSKGMLAIGCSTQLLWPEVNDYAVMIAEAEKIVIEKVSKQGIDDWETILDLSYIQMMLRSSCLPCSSQFKKCPVCSCSSKDLENLLRDQNFQLDFKFLASKNMDGRRFIGNSGWVKICGEDIEDQNMYRQAILHLRRIHKKAV